MNLVEKDGRNLALGTLVSKGFKVEKSAAGGHRSTFIVNGNKLILTCTSNDPKKVWQSTTGWKDIAPYFFAFVLVHWQTKEIHIMPADVYRQKVEEASQNKDKSQFVFIYDEENKYRDNWKILR